MQYCDHNFTLTNFSRENILSECFVESYSSTILAAFIFILGSFQLNLYRKYGTPVVEYHLPRTGWYTLQTSLFGMIAVLTIIKMIVNVVIINDGIFYGYVIESSVLYALMMPFCTYMVRVERLKTLPSPPARGHGVILLVFWAMLLIANSLSLAFRYRHHALFNFDNLGEMLTNIIILINYACCVLIFAIGLWAPGILTTEDYINLHHGSSIDNDDREGLVTDVNSSTWKNFWKKLRKLMPFLWPKNSFSLQCRVIVCFLLLVAGRIINVLSPVYTKLIVDSMVVEPISFRWDYVMIYVGFKFLQGGGTGGMGLLNNLRTFIWIKVQQFTTKEVKVELFRHLHSLSLRWHISRKTGEVLRVMDRGTESIDSLLGLFLFQIIPTFFDIFIAIGYFISVFNIWFGVIVFVTITFYIASTIWITDWRTKYRRLMNAADNKQKAQSVDSLLNFETVKYYGAEHYEVNAYERLIEQFQVEEWKNLVTLNILNTSQNVLICAGLLTGSLLCVYSVVVLKTLTAGDYVLFAAYIIQLYVPLNWFGTFYRQIQNNFVDMENMFALLSEKPEVTDMPSAPAIRVSRGHVQFRNVSFSYVPERPLLRNISFEIEPGRTVALVGPSGSGKTTIVRLLFRFYDVDSGVISIDNENIKSVTQDSLRKAIGVVPQDTVLFNTSIMHNIRYGKLDADDAEVFEAARAADIHDRILTFPDGYQTMVGERGLKLSGGEKQRVAIARTVLKSPMVVMFDEATSSLDTQTERHIQSALSRICQNRTTLIVAHRLSTIIHADRILVMKDGDIVERGHHQELIEKGGLYSQMWSAQLRNENLS